tara:strand:- start:261 stop:494 length:234 start_codon:yes stop_codon:yes gene_type:complete
MNNIKITEINTINHDEIEFLIDVLKHDKSNLKSFLNNKELDYVFILHNKLINRLHNILIEAQKEVTEKRLKKITNKQ